VHLTQAERAVRHALTAGEQPALVALREQLDLAQVARREMRGVGLFAHLEVPAAAVRLPCKYRVIGDVAVTHPALEHGGGALPFVVNGATSTLE